MTALHKGDLVTLYRHYPASVHSDEVCVAEEADYRWLDGRLGNRTYVPVGSHAVVLDSGLTADWSEKPGDVVHVCVCTSATRVKGYVYENEVELIEP